MMGAWHTYYGTACDRCGFPVQLHPAAVVVRACLDTLVNTYAFWCPACMARIERAASAQLVSAMLGAGSRYESFSLPAEVFEVHEGPPINHGDLNRFKLQLGDLP